MSRSLYLAAFAYLGLCLYALASRGAETPVASAAPHPAGPSDAFADASGPGWFERSRGMCNPVEVDVGMRRSPPPDDAQGRAYQAACYALAGKIDLARATIGSLPEGERPNAANVLLSIADPVADAGDDRAAGPMMRLVLEYSPDSYIALYHAGMSEYALGERVEAVVHLRRFLQVYQAEDGWRARARETLRKMGAGEGE